MNTILKIVSKSFGSSSRNLFSVHGYGFRMKYDVVLFKLWLCLLIVSNFTCRIVSGQIVFNSDEVSLFNLSSVANSCSFSDLPPLPDKLEISFQVIPGLLSVKYKCKDGYTLVGDSENLCLKGKWILPFGYHPKCIKYCGEIPFPDISIKGKCELDGETISCNDLIKPKTIAHITCAFGYRKPDVGFVDVIQCSEEGKWDIPMMSRCEQMCFEQPTKFRIRPIPWHVGIFHKIPDSNFHPRFHLECGGTIISAKIVISAAHCFVESLYDTSEFKVIAGNFSRNQEFDPDGLSSSTLATQILNVAELVHNDYMGRQEDYSPNFALLILVDNIIFTPMIQPVCFEVDKNSTQTPVESGLIGKITYVETPYNYMQSMTTLGRDDCITGNFGKYIFDSEPISILDSDTTHFVNSSSKYIDPDKFCGKKFEYCRLDEGTGLVLPKMIGEKTFYFLRGIAAINGRCDEEDPLFTDIQYYTDIISQHLNETRYGADKMNKLNDNFHMYPTVAESSGMEGSCLIPANLSETIQVYYAAQPDREIPKGSYVDPFVDVIYKCKSKYAIVGTNTENICLNGEWNVPNHPECIKLCPPLTYSGITTSATCEINCETISCNQLIKPNTTARLTCTIGYSKTNSFYDVLRCGDDGEWDYQPFRCEPICGIEAPEAKTYIIGGEASNNTKVPWHVGIYSDIYNEGKFKHICGGTILNAKVVISAAHCFWDSKDNQFHDRSNFKVGAGKYYRDFYATEPVEPQILNVTHIYHKSEYNDYAGLYAFDIVLLIVEDYIVFKSYIKPICVETLLYNEKNVAPGLFGRVAGWGLDSSGGMSSAVLKIIDLPAIEYHECKEKFSPEFRPFITPDKFCAGFTDGQSVCEGDSGGGLAFPKMIGGIPVYYLRGIVSAGDNKAGSCDNEKYTVFTNIQYHIDMITFIESTNRPK